MAKALRTSAKQKAALYKLLLEELEHPRNAKMADKTISVFLERRSLAASAAAALVAQVRREGLHNVPLKWPTSDPFRTLVSSAREFNPLEVAMGFFESSYLCNFSALYWNGLSKQVSLTFYVAHERASPPRADRASSPIVFDADTMRDEFMKVPEEPRRVATLGDCRFVILERAYTGLAGVIEKQTMYQGKKVIFRVTDLERTLLDAVVSPDLAGGTSDVLDAFDAAKGKIRIDRLIQTYHQMRLIYPHWQRVGLILEKIIGTKSCNAWREEFGEPKGLFYISKGYKVGWQIDSKWNIAYPAGLFR